jgi:CRISPR-associated protein Cas2
MWAIVFFDMPTDTKADRRQYTIFRKKLLKKGFGMFQFSIYTRHCMSKENAEANMKYVKANLPPKGHIVMMMITDRQFGMMEVFYGPKASKPPEVLNQLEMF